VYAWCVQRVAPEKREAWDLMLSEPLEGLSPKRPSQAQVEAEGQGFMDLMAMSQKMTTGA
jgi:hypothetical protein